MANKYIVDLTADEQEYLLKLTIFYFCRYAANSGQ